MTEFYEFHDSELTAIDFGDKTLVLKIEAYKHIWPDGLEGAGTGWTQDIEITVDEPLIDFAFTSYPVELGDGSLRASILVANAADIIGEDIPGSLTHSSDVEICLEGREEFTGDYKGMRIRGKSAAITYKGEARFVENLMPNLPDHLSE